jgi:hypothetical protein
MSLTIYVDKEFKALGLFRIKRANDPFDIN